MIHKVLRNNAQFYGGFTDLFILGTFRKYNATTKIWESDFTGAADTGRTTTESGTATAYNLIQVTDATTPTTSQAAKPIYTVGFPIGMVVVKYPFSNTADNPKVDVGVANSLTLSGSVITGVAADLELQDRHLLPIAATIPLSPNTASQWLTASITNVTNPVNTLVAKTGNPATVGVDIWIYVTLLPTREWVTNREV